MPMTKAQRRERAEATAKRKRDEWRAYLQRLEAEQRGREVRAREDRWFEALAASRDLVEDVTKL